MPWDAYGRRLRDLRACERVALVDTMARGDKLLARLDRKYGPPAGDRDG